MTRLQAMPDGVWAWRDDLYLAGGQYGGKVRTCHALALQADRGLVTAGSRHSPQVAIVAGIAAEMGLQCRVHVPAGLATAEIRAAAAAGAKVLRHRPGHNSVIVARARDDAAALGWTLIPFGMEHAEAVHQNKQAARHLLAAMDGWRPGRLIIPVGSGMTAAGALHAWPPTVPVLGVAVGADPTARLDRWAPVDWRSRMALVQHPAPYSKRVTGSLADGTRLDPHYEAKAAQYARPGDLLWVVGVRASSRRKEPTRG